MKIERYCKNPIVRPGLYDWQKVSTFNPGVVYNDMTRKYLMYDRAAGSIKPFQTSIGVLESEDGINFKYIKDAPIFTAGMLGFPGGSVEDARVVKIGKLFYMCYALQPYSFDCWPTGKGVPDYFPNNYCEWKENNTEPMITRSGIAVSEDGVNFKQLCYTTPAEIDDRDNTLFPEKINGKFALLRRPLQYVGPEYGTDRPGIWISYSEDLLQWSSPKLVAVSQKSWEGQKIGAAASPLKTDKGWLILYHGVNTDSVYKVGAMLLDLENPEKVIARTDNFIMEPEEYYEKVGLVIPNVVFPTANIIIGDLLYIYYGCCDTCISLATVKLDEFLNYITDGKEE